MIGASLLQTENSKTATVRIQSLDVLRGLIVFVMLFVNDIAGVANVPGWMRHVSPGSTDGMTFVDVVFPAFLFIVGLSLPLAIERRFSKGASKLAVIGHILTRVLSLLVIGVLMVNTENASSEGLLDRRLWNLLMYTSVCLIWIQPSSSGKQRALWMKVGGWLLLIVLAVLFRGRGEPGLIELRTQWWGILGLIGWAYLVAAFAYLLFRQNTLAYAGATVLLYSLYFAHAVNFIGLQNNFGGLISIGAALGSHGAITTSGVLLGLTLIAPSRTHWQRIKTALFLALVLGLTAVLLHSLHDIHRMFYYNKIAATPPWCLLSSAWTALLWAILYWLIEVRGFRFGVNNMAAAGQNALFAFILGPILYSTFALLPLLFGGFSPWGWLGSQFWIGLLRSFALATGGIWLCAFLRRRGFALRV